MRRPPARVFNPGPVCGHPSGTAYSGPGGPEQGKFLKSNMGKPATTHGLPLAAAVGQWYLIHTLFTGPQAGEQAVVRWPHPNGAKSLTQPLAAVRGRPIKEPTLRVVFCIVPWHDTKSRSPGRRPPRRNGGTFRFLLVTKGRTQRLAAVTPAATLFPKTHRSHLSHSEAIWLAKRARSLLAPPRLCSMTTMSRLPMLTSRS